MSHTQLVVSNLADAINGTPPGKLILGINYSGMHDTSVALVGLDGSMIFAESLERTSRIKQDGRPPDSQLQGVDWDRIACVALTTLEVAPPLGKMTSALHPWRMTAERPAVPAHGPGFANWTATLPVQVHHIEHQSAHAHAAFWTSGFQTASILSYDGGMFNSPWFGGLFRASAVDGLEAIDGFHASAYSKATSLYTMVTALLGFTPNKHEGKVTGLAAFGKPDATCAERMLDVLQQHGETVERMMSWVDAYDASNPPFMMVDPVIADQLRQRIGAYPREVMAATVQDLCERHVLEILDAARARSWLEKDICLVGGLFANVKINQRIRESGFARTWVCPPMTDDGAALGAALAIASSQGTLRNHAPLPVPEMFLGRSFSQEDVAQSIAKHGLVVECDPDPAGTIANAMAEGQVVGVFHGRMEFGPRALGNRSILAAATDSGINRSLNDRLRRTEFMPFAPMTRIEDADKCYLGLERSPESARFMTITCDCTTFMRDRCPAVVHVDGTARPQLVHADRQPFIHDIITRYEARTGRPAIVNTSFNIHEEPIVCSPDDAIEGFLGSGLDMLFLEGGYIARLEHNRPAQLACLTTTIQRKSLAERQLRRLVQVFATRCCEADSALSEARLKMSASGAEIGQQSQAATERLNAMDAMAAQLRENAALVAAQTGELEGAQLALRNLATENELQNHAAVERLEAMKVMEAQLRKHADQTAEQGRRHGANHDEMTRLQQQLDEVIAATVEAHEFHQAELERLVRGHLRSGQAATDVWQFPGLEAIAGAESIGMAQDQKRNRLPTSETGLSASELEEIAIERLQLTMRLDSEAKSLIETADERLLLIRRLDGQVNLIAETADERLLLVHRLDVQLKMLAETADERLLLVHRLANDAKMLVETADERLLLVHRLANDAKMLAGTADERLLLVDRLSNDAKMLAGTADERLLLVHRLDQEAKTIAKIADERLVLIQRLDADLRLALRHRSLWRRIMARLKRALS